MYYCPDAWYNYRITISQNNEEPGVLSHAGPSNRHSEVSTYDD